MSIKKIGGIAYNTKINNNTNSAVSKLIGFCQLERSTSPPHKDHQTFFDQIVTSVCIKIKSIKLNGVAFAASCTKNSIENSRVPGTAAPINIRINSNLISVGAHAKMPYKSSRFLV